MDYYKQVTEKLPEQLNLRPSRWVHSYEEFIAKNASAVTQIESALRSLTYVIPGTALDFSNCMSQKVH